jgi:hypothetical protein
MKSIQRLKGAISIILTVLLGVMFIVNACSNDDDNGGDDPEVNPLVGKYVFVSAKLTAPYELMPGATFPVGFDMSNYVEAGLLGATPCTDLDDTRVELRESGELYYVCQGEDAELKVGTWTNSADMSQLILNLSSPPLPADLPLVIKDLEVNSVGIKGNIENLPIPISLFEDLIPEGVDPDLLPEVLIVSLYIEFDRVD